MDEINIPLVFIYGLLSFLSPCVFPLFPPFVSYLLGISVDSLDGKNDGINKKVFVINICLFLVGSMSILTLIGVTVGSLGYLSSLLNIHGVIIQQVLGAIVLLFAFDTLNVFELPFLHKYLEFKGLKSKIWVISKSHIRLRYIESFLLGVVFSLGHLPCGASLVSTLVVIASYSTNNVYGIFLMFIYSLGQNLPFLIFGILILKNKSYFNLIKKHRKIFQIISGIFFVFLGTIMILGYYYDFTQYLYNFALINIYKHF